MMRTNITMPGWFEGMGRLTKELELKVLAKDRPIFEAALEYHQQGLWPIPVHPDKKQPLILWAEFQARQPTVEELYRWWAEFPNARIGLVTGAGPDLVAIDLDPRNGGNPEEMDVTAAAPREGGECSCDGKTQHIQAVREMFSTTFTKGRGRNTPPSCERRYGDAQEGGSYMNGLQAIRCLSGSGAKLLLLLLAECGEAGQHEASMEELVSATGMKEETIRVARRELENLELVAIASGHGGRGSKTIYKLPLPVGESLGKLLLQKGTSERGGSSLFKDNSLKPGKRNETKKENKDSNKKRKEKKKDELDTPSLSPPDELLLYEKACKILGAPFYPNSSFAYLAKRSMRARLREGFPKEDLIAACRYAAKEWDNGNRWSQLKNLIYIWSKGFQPLLATKGEAGIKTRGKAPVFREGEDLEKYKEEIRRREES